jgi:hypothetical protein
VLAQHRRPPAPCCAYLKLRLQGGFRQRAGWRERRAGRARGAFAGASWPRYADGAIVSTCMRGASWRRYADGEGRDGMAQDAGEGCVGARTRVHHAFPPYHVERPAAGSPMKLVISRVCSTARAQQTHEGDTPMRSEGSIERVADERGTTSSARRILVWALRRALE